MNSDIGGPKTKVHPINRIISLVPSNTEILYYLGLQTRVVGVTEHCNFPEEANNKNKVGTFGQPQLSSILSLKPDLVLADRVLHKKLIVELENKDVQVLANTPSSINDLFNWMSKLGKLCETEITVQKAIVNLRKRTQKISLKSLRSTLRVFYLMSTDPFVTPGSGSIQYDALRIAGAKLIDFHSDDPYVQVPLEQIKEFDPEVILFCGIEKGQTPLTKCRGCIAKKPICQRTVDDILTKDWEQITAVRENRVYPIPCHTICRPGPRLIEGIEELNCRYFQT